MSGFGRLSPFCLVGRCSFVFFGCELTQQLNVEVLSTQGHTLKMGLQLAQFLRKMADGTAR